MHVIQSDDHAGRNRASRRQQSPATVGEDVWVRGEVKTEVQVGWVQGRIVAEVIDLAGGFTDFATGVFVIRGKDAVFQLLGKQAIRKPMALDFQLNDQDIVVVRRMYD